MANDFRLLKLRQLDKQLNAWYLAAKKAPMPKAGWLRTLRKALGLGTGQLARRMGAHQPWVLQLEKAEVSGAVTLASLKKAADALGCDFVYGIVPREPLENMVRKQAEHTARIEFKSVSHSMALENQRPVRTVESRQFKTLRDSLLAGPWRRLWK